VYANVVAGFSQPAVSGAYAVAMVSLCLHLYHGLYSFFLTMGFNHPTYTPRIRAGAQVVAVALAAGFLSIPVAVLAGVIKA
jgi:succinate dehydrogenase / fumarate reductase cytochrome b subunit